MLRPALVMCGVIGLGSVITLGIVSIRDPVATDARGNPLPRLNPREVEQAANEPYVSPRLLTAM